MTNDKLAATFHGADNGVDLLGALGGAIERARELRQEPDPTPEQALRAHIADLLTDVDHFDGCKANEDCDCDFCVCTCLIGRIRWAINAEQVAS